MKICPRCGHLEDNRDYCRICRQCLTYDSPLTAEQAGQAREPRWNAYKLLYHLKQLSVPAAGLGVSLLCMAAVSWLGGGVLPWCAVGSVFFGAVSLLLGLAEWPLVRRRLSGKETDADYQKAVQRVQRVKLALAFAGILLAGIACAV